MYNKTSLKCTKGQRSTKMYSSVKLLIDYSKFTLSDLAKVVLEYIITQLIAMELYYVC